MQLKFKHSIKINYQLNQGNAQYISSIINLIILCVRFDDSYKRVVQFAFTSEKSFFFQSFQSQLIFTADPSFSVFFWTYYFHKLQLLFPLFAPIYGLWFSVPNFFLSYLLIISGLSHWVLFVRFHITIWLSFFEIWSFVWRVKCLFLIFLFIRFRTPFLVRTLG